MALTTDNADYAFKRYYLGTVTDQLNLKTNPFLARVKQSSTDIYGKEVKKLIRYGVNGGVGAGPESGDLPTPRGSNYVQLTLPLKNLYGTIQISDKAIRASANSEGAFVNLLNEEMEYLVESASYNLSRMLFGTSTGTLAKVVSTHNYEVTVDDARNFTEGMIIDLYSTSGSKVESALIVKSVDRDKKVIVLDKQLSSAEGYSLFVSGSRGYELTGLASVFDSDSVYGVPRFDSAWFVPYKKTVETLTESEIQMALDRVEENSGGKINFIICSWGVRRALINLLTKNGVAIETMTLEDGTQAISYHGIPVVVDRFCPKGTMFLLNTDDFTLFQLCDWQWLEDENGKVLKQVPGKAIFSATIVKYADLMCTRPCGQARLSGITEE